MSADASTGVDPLLVETAGELVELTLGRLQHRQHRRQQVLSAGLGQPRFVAGEVHTGVGWDLNRVRGVSGAGFIARAGLLVAGLGPQASRAGRAESGHYCPSQPCRIGYLPPSGMNANIGDPAPTINGDLHDTIGVPAPICGSR